jgi:hypothetical protein
MDVVHIYERLRIFMAPDVLRITMYYLYNNMSVTCDTRVVCHICTQTILGNCFWCGSCGDTSCESCIVLVRSCYEGCEIPMCPTCREPFI